MGKGLFLAKACGASGTTTRFQGRIRTNPRKVVAVPPNRRLDPQKGKADPPEEIAELAARKV